MFNRLALTAAMLGSLTLTACGGDDSPAPASEARAPSIGQAPATDAPPRATKNPAATRPPRTLNVPQPTRTVAVGAKGNPAALGTAVFFKDSAWSVREVQNRGSEIDDDNEYSDNPKTTGVFLQVSVAVRNNGSKKVTITGPVIVDDKGREFEYNSDATITIVDDAQYCSYEDLNPGLEKLCAWIYDLPADATGLKLAMKEELFGGDPLYAAVEAVTP